MTKDKKYKTIITTAYYVYDKKTETLEWAENEAESKQVEEHNTIEEALNSASDWGSKWVMYNGLIIEDAEGSEVYSDIPALYKCECCGNEKWERVIGDMRRMQTKEGKRLFPDLK